jgi:ABC-type phosphate transport system substrate-binding protein
MPSLMVLAVVVAVIQSLGGATAPALAATTGRCGSATRGEYGLEAGTPAPAYAKTHHIHWFTERHATSAAASEVFACPFAGGSGETLKYGGGPVQHAPKLYLLYWGKNWELAPNREIAEYLNLFYYNLKAENTEHRPGSTAVWQGTLTQYGSSEAGSYQPAQVVEAGIGHITSVPAMSTAQTMQLIREGVEEFAWSLKDNYHQTLDQNTQIIVLPAPGSRFRPEVLPKTPEGQTCGFHGTTAAVYTGAHSGESYSYSFVPYAGDVSEEGCIEALGSQPVRASTTVEASHEFAESVTDPGTQRDWINETDPFQDPETGEFHGTGWVGNLGNPGKTEIGDLCENRPGLPLHWTVYVSQIWDDEHGNTCSIEDPPYPPQSPPAITPGVASGIGTSSATVSAVVNPEVPETTYFVKYGLSTAYESRTRGYSAGVGALPLPVSVPLTGLAHGSLYHYRFVASNWAGTSESPDQTFTTHNPPPEVVTGAGTPIGPVSARIRGSIRAPYGGPDEWYFRYGTSPQNPTGTPVYTGGPGSSWEHVETTLEGLKPNTTYHFWFYGRTTGGTVKGQEGTFITPRSPYAATLRAQQVTEESAELLATIGAGGLQTSYQFEYWAPGGEHHLAPAAPGDAGHSTGLTTVSAQITGLTPGVNYSYRVHAASEAGDSYGEVSAFATSPVFASQPVPEPGDGLSRFFRAVSCTSPVFCVTLGYSKNPQTLPTAANSAAWDGSRWNTVALPLPPGTTESFPMAVSCVSPTFCGGIVRVTSSTYHGAAVFERWDGSAWHYSEISTNEELGSWDLTSISCVASECVLVGGVEKSAKHVPFAERWNGTRVERMQIPPQQGESATLYGVSCTAVNSCLAVGNDRVGFGPGGSEVVEPVVEQLSSRIWKVVASPSVSQNTVMWAVSCVTATWCKAVGGTGSGELETPAAYQWNGSSWTQDPFPPSAVTRFHELSSVSCSSEEQCVAWSHSQGLRWSGGQWLPANALEETWLTIEGVSCVPEACTAVGNRRAGGPTVPYAASAAPPRTEQVSAANLTEEGATLRGIADAGGKEGTWVFEYGPTEAYGTSIPSSPVAFGGWAQEPLTESIAHLRAGTTYHFRLVLNTAAGTAASPDQTFTTTTSACGGFNILGRGGAETASAVSAWGTTFNTSNYGCNGVRGTKARPEVSYAPSGREHTLDPWDEAGANYSETDAFQATLEAPTSAEIAAVQARASTAAAEPIETIPVAQTALAVIVNLPAGCTAESGRVSARLVMSPATLAGIFSGTIRSWDEIQDGGDVLEGATCTAHSPITVVVPALASGTDFVFKHYLAEQSSEPLLVGPGNVKTWNELAESTLNTVWPAAAGAAPSTNVTKTVGETPGSIGFANLADVRSTELFSGAGGGPGTQRFWVPIRSHKEVYVDPSTNGDAGPAAAANCKKSVFSNGVESFPPATVMRSWSGVGVQATSKTYGLCALVYIVALHPYGAWEGTSAGEAQTVRDFVGFITSKQAQAELATRDLSADPKVAKSLAEEGLFTLKF